MTQTFPSKIDTWLIVVIGLSLIPAALGATAALQSADMVERVLTLVAAVVGLGLPVWVLASTDYTVSPELLHIRSGPFQWRIPTSTIVELRASHNPLSSPALSLDRIDVITSRGRTIRVSPDDRVGFCAALRAANPDLRTDKSL